MTQRDNKITIQQMLDHAREAIALVEGRERDVLDTDRMRCLALIRLVEIIGEAANRVTPEYKDRTPSVPWSSMIGLRNRLIHGYDAINHDMLWQILSSDLPILIQTLDALLAEEK